MPSYDFSTLSPSDFEILSRDLLQRHFRLNFESFRTGRDRGIDLRYSRPKGGDLWIVQAKHYIRSGFSKLKAVLAESESTKLA
jgi:HJR/Mrr/RecB family endonuclease